MTAVLIPTASEAEWLAARRQGITASEIAVVMGLSPYSSPYKLYHQKLGILPEQDDTAVFERGRVLEPYIAEKFAAAHPELRVLGDGRELYAHPERGWQMATPDRMLHVTLFEGGQAAGYYLKPDSVLETKTDGGSDEWGEPGTSEIPVHYRCQALWQMDVMSVDRAYVACLRIRDWRLLEYEVGHAEGCGAGRNMLAYPSLACQACDDIMLMREAARDFLDRIDSRDEPDVDWRPSTTDALKRLHPSLEDTGVTIGKTLAGQYRAACAAVKRAEKRKALAENRIRVRLGNGRTVTDPDGQLVATRQVYDVKEHVRKASTVNKLVPPRARKEASE